MLLQICNQIKGAKEATCPCADKQNGLKSMLSGYKVEFLCLLWSPFKAQNHLAKVMQMDLQRPPVWPGDALYIYEYVFSNL